MRKQDRDCLSCSRYLKCGDPDKASGHICLDFKVKRDLSLQEIVDMAEADSIGTGPIGGGEIDMSDVEGYDDGKKKKSTDEFDILARGKVNIRKIVDTVLESDMLTPVDTKIDDSSIPRAKNFLEFTTGHKFLNVTPYAMQIAYGTIVFSEYCPDCSDTEYLFKNVGVKDTVGEFVERVKLLEKGVCPCCGGRKSEFVRDGKMHFYQELAGLAGQRSGKSALVAMLATYLLHILLKLQNPNEVYGLLKANVLHGTFVALTYKQAAETLWEPFLAYLMEAPWFVSYHKLLDAYGKQYEDEFYKIKDTFVVYKHRRILMYPSGPNKKTLRGRTRVFSSIDEIGWFDNSKDDAKVKMSAHEVYVALDRSLLTVRGAATRLLEQGFDDIPTAFAFNISSPSSARDKIMELVEQSKTSRKIFGFKKPTWEMNPRLTKDDLAEEYQRDPVAAERDYGCNPPLSDSAFYTSKAAVEDVFGTKRNRSLIQFYSRKARDGTATRYAKFTSLKKLGKPSVLALDAGYSNNSFACAVGCLHQGIPTISNLVEIMPLAGVPLNHSLIYEHIIKPIIAEFNVKLMISDRWQNIKILQDAEVEHDDLYQVSYSLKYDDIWKVKQMVMDQEIAMPSLEGRTIEDVLKYDHNNYPHCFVNDPVGHLALQFLTVRDMGNTVGKGDGLTDDLYRAVNLAVWALDNEEFLELWDMEEVNTSSVAAALGAVHSLKGAGHQPQQIATASNGRALGFTTSFKR